MRDSLSFSREIPIEGTAARAQQLLDKERFCRETLRIVSNVLVICSKSKGHSDQHEFCGQAHFGETFYVHWMRQPKGKERAEWRE